MRVAIRSAIVATVVSLGICSAQEQQQQQQQQPPAQPSAAQQVLNALSSQPVRPNYILNPNDQILIRVPEAEELNDKPFRIDTDGSITLPLVGKLTAAGQSLEQFEATLTKALQVYVRNPQVSLSLVQFRSDPIFLMGAFQKPGVYSLQGQHTLVEMLIASAGLQPNASRRIRVTRRLEHGHVPLPNAVDDPEAKTSSVEISLNRLMETTSPAENLVLEPYDVIHAFTQEMVYTQGEGLKAGAYPLSDRDSLSVIQLISLAGGLVPKSSPEKSKILRPILDTAKRAEIPINVKDIMSGRANDYPLMPGDVLYVPGGSVLKSALTKPLVILPGMASALVWILVR